MPWLSQAVCFRFSVTFSCSRNQRPKNSPLPRREAAYFPPRPDLAVSLSLSTRPPSAVSKPQDPRRLLAARLKLRSLVRYSLLDRHEERSGKDSAAAPKCSYCLGTEPLCLLLLLVSGIARCALGICPPREIPRDSPTRTPFNN